MSTEHYNPFLQPHYYPELMEEVKGPVCPCGTPGPSGPSNITHCMLVWKTVCEAPSEILASEDDVVIAYTCMVAGLQENDYMRTALRYFRSNQKTDALHRWPAPLLP